MGYYEFRIVSPAEAMEALVERTAAMGSLGSVVDEGVLVTYFPDVLGINEIIGGLTSFKAVLGESGLAGDISFEYVFLSERDWNESWKKKFQPLDLGEGITVIPPWEPPRQGRVNLIIDPGMAFGTGHHETTTRCLTIIERLAPAFTAASYPETGGGETSFLDVGTGTGILAIAASKLGFRRVVGVDIDPLAVDAARRNVAQNGLDNVLILEGSVTAAPAGAYDVIAANLLLESLTALAPGLAVRLRPGGILVASGMIDGQEEEAIPRMREAGLRDSESHRDGRWVSVVFRR